MHEIIEFFTTLSVLHFVLRLSPSTTFAHEKVYILDII